MDINSPAVIQYKKLKMYLYFLDKTSENYRHHESTSCCHYINICPHRIDFVSTFEVGCPSTDYTLMSTYAEYQYYIVWSTVNNIFGRSLCFIFSDQHHYAFKVNIQKTHL